MQITVNFNIILRNATFFGVKSDLLEYKESLEHLNGIQAKLFFQPLFDILEFNF